MQGGSHGSTEEKKRFFHKNKLKEQNKMYYFKLQDSKIYFYKNLYCLYSQKYYLFYFL